MLLGRYSELGGAAVIAVAALIAVIAGICVYFFYVKPMENSESSTGYSMKELSGVIAEVLVPIPAVGYGEVIVKAGAGVSNQIAASFEGTMIPSGARVVVIEVKDNTLYVSKLEL
jgi:membrane protein implicated in regulation of membrane protease activity